MSERPKKWTKWFNVNMLGLLLLVGALGFSLHRIYAVRQELFDPDVTILRISHWQLELGYRDSMDKIIKEYEALWAAKGKKVRILQMPVTETVYGQWLNTHLISGDAPDLAGMGMTNIVNNDQYVVRYFVPLTSLINQPNPYNKGTSLENVPWRETFIDGMRGAYRDGLQDYYSVPTAFFNLRMFYNKTLVKQATGEDRPPQTFGQLMELCRAIRLLPARGDGVKVIPIAGSKYSAWMFGDKYLTAFTAGFEPILDLDLDGYISPNETYVGVLRQQVGLDFPKIKAGYELMHDLSAQFSDGFYGKDRQTAAFEFVQGRAAMIATGSWDAGSLFVQAKEAGFELGIFDFPLPGPGEKYAQYVTGRASEAANSAAGLYGLYKFSRNQEQALDFLQFLTSRKYNQLMMEGPEWLPVIVGTRPSKRMAAFAIDPRGYTCSVRFAYGSDSTNVMEGEMQSYLQGYESYAVFSKSLMAALMSPTNGGDRAWVLEYDSVQKQARNQDRILAMQAARQLMDPSADQDASAKYRQVLVQQVRNNNGQWLRWRYEKVRNEPMPEK